MTRTQKLGWIVAAAFLGLISASAFVQGFEKVATVDLSTIVETSDLGKANIAFLDGMKNSRESLLKFMDENRVLTAEQARNLRVLWLKDNPTANDTATLDRLKADINAQAKKNVELSTKANLTPEERSLLQEFSSRSATIEQIANEWYGDFRQEIQQAAQERRIDTLNKAKSAAQTVAKLQGYTLVFDNTVAVYAANDLTADALKTMNAKK